MGFINTSAIYYLPDIKALLAVSTTVDCLNILIGAFHGKKPSIG
jgi:hypothetical protein